MACTGSVRDSSFTDRLAPASVTAESKTSTAPGSRTPPPGLRIMSAPANPHSVAPRRLPRTTSPRNSAAPRITNSGEVKPRATASASGTIEMAVNHMSMVATPRAQRRV